MICEAFASAYLRTVSGLAQLPFRAILFLGLLALLGCDAGNVHFTNVTLSTGDTLIQEGTYHRGFVESVTTHRLFIQWKGSKRRELIANSVPSLLSSKPVSTAVWRSHGWIVIKVGRELFYRREGPSGDWNCWYLMSNPELFESVRNALISAGQSFQESTESGVRIIYFERADAPAGPRQKEWISIGEGLFNLPYDIVSIDFDANQVVTRRTMMVPGLPETIIFKGPSGEFGRWICNTVQ